jgi:NitT/TauT family transport system substrate-binding protein
MIHKKQCLLSLIALVSMATNSMTSEPVKLRLGTLGHSLGFLQVDIAEVKGWLETDNLDTEIVYFKSGKECSTALLSGSLDAAVLGVDHAITGQIKGISIKQTALLNRLPGWIFVASNRLRGKVSSPAQLKGLRVGVTSPGSATHILSSYLLHKYGLTADDFIIVKSGSATLPDIMRNNGIDVGMAMEPYGSILLDSNDAYLLVDFRSVEQTRKNLGALYPVTALLIREDFIKKHRAAAQDVTTAIVWGCKWLKNATADEVIDLLPKEYIPNPGVWKTSFEASRDVFPPDGMTDVEGIKAVVEAQVVFGKLEKAGQLSIENLYDNSFWEIANTLPLPSENVHKKASDSESSNSAVWILVVVPLLLLGLYILIVRKKRQN